MANMYTEKEKIVSFVKSMPLEEIVKPLDREQIAKKVNIDNPLIVDLLDYWIKIRRQRIVLSNEVWTKMQ